MKFRSCFLAAVVALSVYTASIQQARAVLPVLVWAVARQAAVFTAQSVAIGVIAKGFSANDPYVRTTATIGRSRLAQNMATSLRGPRWAGLAALTAAFAGLGWDYDEDIGLHTLKSDWPQNSYCPSTNSLTSVDACVISSFGRYSDQGGFTEPQSVSCLNWIDNSACINKTPITVVYYCYYGLMGNSCSNSVGTPIFFNQKNTVVRIPVPAAEIESKGLPQLAASPNTLGDMFAGANPDMLNKLFDGATIPYNATNPTPEMAQLKADYRNGLLQSVDPNAPHYVTPEQMKQVQDLVAAENAANTDDGTIEALNEKMKQPITQVQYEESNKKYSDAVDSVTNTLPNNGADIESIDDSFNKIDGIITDLPNTSLPAPAHMTVPEYVDCQQIHLSDGNGHELDFPSPAQCAKIETFKEGFGYFLAVSVVFLLGMQLLTRPHG